MILNNYWELVRLQNTYPMSADGSAAATTALIDINNHTAQFAYGMQSSLNDLQYLIPNYTIFGNNISIKVGSSTEEGEPSDYSLKSSFDERYYSIQNLSINSSVESDGGIKRQITFNVINNNSMVSSVTINEVGIVKTINSAPSSGFNAYIMIARIILDEPLTLAYGATGVITLLWVES